MRHLLVLLAFALVVRAQDVFRFAVIGDSGTGGRAQHEVGELMASWHQRLPFASVLMLGDNLYGSQRVSDYQAKFERPYAKLLEGGVSFYAALGNHDSPGQKDYPPFHMNGLNYYSISPAPGVRFFALDSTRVDRSQLAWLENELSRSREAWKIAFFHHPIYSSGARHGSDLALRAQLEPLFVKYGVALVFSGHDHIYERIRPQQGVHYFVVGSSAKLRAGNARRTSISAYAFDRDHSFLTVEVGSSALRYQAISRTGEVVDSGTIAQSEMVTSPSPSDHDLP